MTELWLLIFLMQISLQKVQCLYGIRILISKWFSQNVEYSILFWLPGEYAHYFECLASWYGWALFKFFLALLQPCRDTSGAAIAVFTARLHDPRATTQQTTLQGVVYQLDAALESRETQRCGLIFIYDMSESAYQNFDYQLSQKILTLLKVMCDVEMIWKLRIFNFGVWLSFDSY